MSRNLDADVVVIGQGIVGANTLWRLAERGVRVIGIEQFQLGHAYGSSHGRSRVFRMACVEHPGLAPVAKESARLFAELSEPGDPLLVQSGGLMLGPEGHRVVGGALAAANAHDIEVEVLDGREIRDRFPVFAHVADHHVGVHDPQCGHVKAEESVLAAVRAAEKAGARVVTGTRVLDVTDEADHVVVKTALGVVRAGQVVVCTGPWISRLTDIPVRVERAPMLWFESPQPEGYTIEGLPVFIREFDNGDELWGHGHLGDGLIKLGPFGDPTRDRRTDPDLVERAISPADWAYVSRMTAETFGHVNPAPSRVVTCMTTLTPDNQFLVGRAPGRPRLLMGGAGNGHMFKHGPGIGEALARVAVEEDPLFDLSFMDPARFEVAP